MENLDLEKIRSEKGRLVDEKIASQLSCKSVSTLQSDRHHKRGIPFCKIGKLCRYRVGDILNYLDGNFIQTRG
jgi:hypothetical protein